MLEHSGKLMVRVPRRTATDASLAAEGFLDDYYVEPLFPAFERRINLLQNRPRPKDFWLLAKERSRDYVTHPWDLAHGAARQSEYKNFAEPDLLQDFSVPPPIPPMPLPSTSRSLFVTPSLPVAPANGMDPDWPPKRPVSPGWHLEKNFTGFATVRDKALGTGIRIAHLDTGYSPQHVSTPENVGLGWNFYENNDDPVDPGMTGILLMPGHGTATLALLAAPNLNLFFGELFSGYFGGAPKAEVVPIRISPSVIHLFTSAMARGIDYALAPRDNPKNKCDVITISAGGLPAACWAAAVNHAYEAGIVIVAASGNNFNLGAIDFPMSSTVWPSRYQRVITVVGATYDKTPYRTNVFGEMQGNYGPESVMQKAVAAFTPNVAWMQFRTREEYGMSGAGTSSATPQVAAACALWLELHGKKHSEDYRRVEACRRALFRSATRPPPQFKKYLGRGYLNVPKLLKESSAKLGDLRRSPIDGTEYKPWRAVAGSSTGVKDEMFEVEATQVISRSRDPELVTLVFQVESGLRLPSKSRRRMLELLRQEPEVSEALKERLAVLLREFVG